MIGGTQPKIEGVVLDNELVLLNPLGNWKLTRLNDGLTKISESVKWITWNENGTFKEEVGNIKKGSSLIMSPFNPNYTWLTTEIVSIEKDESNYKKFKTKNSEYELIKI